MQAPFNGQAFLTKNLVPSFLVNTGDGPDPDASYSILNRGKRHDYFTSCLPWSQKGPAVTLPLGSTAPVKRDPAPLHGGQFLKPGGILIPAGGTVTQSAVPNLTIGGDIVSYDPRGTLYADLSTATAATINAIRTAFQVQKLLERDARGGTRYTEIIRSHFGVVSPDSRFPVTIFGGF